MNEPSLSRLPVTKDPWWKTKIFAVSALALLLLIVALLAVNILKQTVSQRNSEEAANPTPSVTLAASPTIATTPSKNSTAPTPSPTIIAIRTYFSKHPDSDTDSQKVFAVDRTSNSLGVAKAALSALITGPTAEETADGYFSEWKLSGVSNCSGDDFSLSVEQAKATVRLCKDFSSAGIGQDARAQAEATATLTQFENITSAVYLNKNGDCLFDESGQNACKR